MLILETFHCWKQFGNNVQQNSFHAHSRLANHGRNIDFFVRKFSKICDWVVKFINIFENKMENSSKKSNHFSDFL